MLSKPDTCKTCPLYSKGQGFVPDLIVSQPDYAFIGEAPGGQEIVKGTPFIGEAGYVLREWLVKAVPTLKLALEKQKVSILNTLRCLPPKVQGRNYPTGQEKIDAEKCCSQYDNLGTAKVVVLFGEHAQRKWFGPELEAEDLVDRKLGHEVKGVHGRMGRTYEKDGKTWVFSPHPAWILRQPALVEAGQQTLRIAAQTEKVVEVEYMKWEEAIAAIVE